MLIITVVFFICFMLKSITEFSLAFAPVVNVNDVIPSAGGVAFLDPQANPPFSTSHPAFLTEIPFEKFSDRFDFDTDIIVQAAIRKYRIMEIPHKTRYWDENSKMSFKRGVIYGLSILRTLSLYMLHKSKIVKNQLFEKRK